MNIFVQIIPTVRIIDLQVSISTQSKIVGLEFVGLYNVIDDVIFFVLVNTIIFQFRIDGLRVIFVPKIYSFYPAGRTIYS